MQQMYVYTAKLGLGAWFSVKDAVGTNVKHGTKKVKLK